MKLLIFILGLAVASATISITPQVKDITVPHTYQDVGKSFIYKYEAFINSTLPQSGVEFVGQKIKCDVELNILTSQIIHMNLTNILVQEVNGTYNATLKEKNFMYPVNISVWNSSLTQNYTRELRNPITFHYVNGKILKVFANKTDPEWVVNMKKGIINMLTLQMENDDVFTKKEEGISGTCQTVYQVEERRNKDNIKVFNITKVRDMTNCTDSPTWKRMTNDLKTCKECDKETTQPIKAIATFKYNVTGERNKFFIESCKSDASYVLVPRTDMDKGSYAVFQNQSLVLKEVKSKEIRQTTDLTERGSIKFVFPKIVDDMDKWNTTLKKVEFFTNILSNQTFTNFTLDTPSHFINLVRSLRECNITQMRQVWNWTEKTMYKRDWIIKALPYVNKTDMTQLVKEMFFNRTINVTSWHGEELLTGLGTVQYPTVKMIQDIRDVCEMDLFREPITDVPRENITKTLSLRRACWVTLGNMMNRFYKTEKFVPSTLVRSLTDCEETWMNPLLNPSFINKDTYKMLMEVRTTDVKLHCMESMGNAGLPDHVEQLRETIEQKTKVLPMDVRIVAVTSLRRVAKELPRKVMTILLPVLKNPTEDPEMRVTAYLTMLECEPTPAMLTLITEELNKWTNPEVRTFIWTHLKNLAKSTNPLEKKIAMSARYAILSIQPLNVTLKTSQNRRMEMFTEDKKLGAKCELDTVFGTQNIIPRKINFRCDAGLNGHFLNLMELNVHTDSLNDVLDRVFGTHGSFYKRKSLFDMLNEKRTDQTRDYTKLELDNLKKKVNPYTKQTYRHASTQFKMFDTEMWFKKLDDKFFDELMDVGKLSTKMVDIEMELMKPQRFNTTKVMMFEAHQQFPTIMGMPLSLNTTMGTIMRMMVNTTFTAQPNLQDVTHTDLVAKVNVTPEIIFINTRTFGCHTPLNKLVAETNNTGNFSLPLVTTLTVDYDTKKYSIEFDHFQKDRVDIFNIKHNTSLFHEKTMCGKGQVFKKNITIINGTQTGTPINTTMCFSPYEDSTKLCLNVTTFKMKKMGEPSIAFRGPLALEVFAKKGTYTPDKVVVEYEPRDLHLWTQGTKTANLKIKFVADKTKKPTFVDRFITADMELTDRRPVRDNDDRYSFTMTLKKSDVPDWRAKIKGFQRWTKNVEVDCQWGMPKEQVIFVNKTEKTIQREFFVRFVSDRWVLPTQTMHNMTLLWADTPKWLKTVGETYKTWAPTVKYMLFKTLTPWEMTIEPKRNWIDSSYGVCLKTKSNETMDLIFVMPDQEITITNMTSPVCTEFLKKPLPAIIKSIIKPNITLIPSPKTCKINNTGIRTFDSVRVNYTLPNTCPHILVKDCSSDERFTVLVQNVTLREETNTVKTGLKTIVYVSKRKFELITKLDTDRTTKILEVKVDGQRYLENWKYQNKPTVEQEIENTNTTLRRNETHISLISGQGFTVVLSTVDLQVNVTQRHWNTSCGLCGNNDEEKENEFRTPWTTLPTHVRNDTKFGVSWLVPGDDCYDPECKLRKFVSFPLNRIEDEEVVIGNNKAACFSTEPVFYCPVDCVPVPMTDVFPNSQYTPKKMTVEVGFSCIRTNDPTTEYRKSKDQSFTTKVVDLVKEVEVPRKCNCLNTCIDSNKRW